MEVVLDQERPDIAGLGEEPAGEQAVLKGRWGSYLVQMPYATSILNEAVQLHMGEHLSYTYGLSSLPLLLYAYLLIYIYTVYKHTMAT